MRRLRVEIQRGAQADRVRVTNVFHGGRDFEALYAGAPPDEGSAPQR